MSFRDILGLSLRNLSQAKLRTFLTMLGVSIGIAALAGMLGLGVGLQDQIVGRFLHSGVFDTINVTSPSELGAAAAFLNAGGRGGFRAEFNGRGGLRGGAAPNPQSPPLKLDAEALKQIAAIENVRAAYPTLRFPMQLTVGDFSRTVGVAGVPMSSKGEGVFQTFSFGDFFTSESAGDCMLGLNLAKQIAEKDPGSLVGKSLKLAYVASTNGFDVNPLAGFQVRRSEMQCRVTGIVERDSQALPFGPNASVMLPMSAAEKIDGEIIADAQAILGNLSSGKSYGAATVRVRDPKFTQDVEDRIRRMGYAAISVNDALRGAKSAFIIFDILQSVIGSIALTVAALGIVNTMVMSILERTREIGIMKAIGASDE